MKARKAAQKIDMRRGQNTSAGSRAKARKEKPRRERNPQNLKTALWMLFFPVGLTMMWRRGCTWPKAVKIAVSGLFAAAIVAVLVLPTPANTRTAGGIELVGGDPEVEVYGPELPNFIVPGYTNELVDSVIAPVEETSVHYVYAADGARCYHEYECKFAFASSQRLTVYEAYYLGFEPCGRCHPPVYDPVTGATYDQTATAAAAATAEPQG